MHGVGHPLGLDVHDIGLTVQPMQAGWVMTVEPAIYLREEGFAVRLEDNVLIAKNGPVDLMAHVPIEAGEIEALMTSGVKPLSSKGQRHEPIRTRRRTAPVGN
jgi:Xaa-Pro aminopeptidase